MPGPSRALERLTVASFFGSTLAAASPAAAAPTAVDVVIRDPDPPRRTVAIELNPLALIVQRVSFNVEVMPIEHHALIFSPYYFRTKTTEIFQSTTDAGGSPLTLDIPPQTFEGFGAELGYRYYFGQAGMRGLFLGPSLRIARGNAQASDGSTTGFSGYGIAADVGYQLLVANDWVVSLGGGLEYDFATKSIPAQQWPANLYANNVFRPRLLLALGYAF